MFKRKGQIVPKYLVKSVEKKAQHLLTFGCDVEIKGRKITALSEGPCFVYHNVKYCNTKKNKRTVKGFIAKGITFIAGEHNVKITGNTDELG